MIVVGCRKLDVCDVPKTFTVCLQVPTLTARKCCHLRLTTCRGVLPQWQAFPAPCSKRQPPPSDLVMLPSYIITSRYCCFGFGQFAPLAAEFPSQLLCLFQLNGRLVWNLPSAKRCTQRCCFKWECLTLSTCLYLSHNVDCLGTACTGVVNLVWLCVQGRPLGQSRLCCL